MILNKHPDKEKIIVKTEMAHFVHSYKVEKLAQAKEGQDNSSRSVPNVPTNEDVITKVRREVDKQISVHINKICATVWVGGSGQCNWFLGYVTDEQQDGYLVDHLHRVNSGSHQTWGYPSKEDFHLSEQDQILPCEIIGQWDLRDHRNAWFALKNVKDKLNSFNNLAK